MGGMNHEATDGGSVVYCLRNAGRDDTVNVTRRSAIIRILQEDVRVRETTFLKFNTLNAVE